MNGFDWSGFTQYSKNEFKWKNASCRNTVFVQQQQNVLNNNGKKPPSREKREKEKRRERPDRKSESSHDGGESKENQETQPEAVPVTSQDPESKTEQESKSSGLKKRGGEERV